MLRRFCARTISLMPSTSLTVCNVGDGCRRRGGSGGRSFPEVTAVDILDVVLAVLCSGGLTLVAVLSTAPAAAAAGFAAPVDPTGDVDSVVPPAAVDVAAVCLSDCVDWFALVGAVEGGSGCCLADAFDVITGDGFLHAFYSTHLIHKYRANGTFQGH